MAHNGRILRSSAPSLVLNLLCLLSLTVPAFAKVGPTLPRPENPFLDPKHDPYNPLKYIASNAPTGVAFSLVVVVAFIQTWFIRKWGAKWMLSMVIGEFTFAIGIGTRFGLHSMPESKGLYIAEYLFVVLSPCAFIAADYVLLGRLSQHLDCAKYLMVPAKRITIIFISSDISTFLVQAAGGSLSISANDLKRNETGANIFLAGLALQLASFLIFTCIFLVFLYRVRKHSPEIWMMDEGKKWHQDWRALAFALFVSCVGILIRSVYRTVELSQGYGGHLASVEAFFYGLDTLPLFLAVAIYVPFWPGRFIPPFEKSPVEVRTTPSPTGSEVVEKV